MCVRDAPECLSAHIPYWLLYTLWAVYMYISNVYKGALSLSCLKYVLSKTWQAAARIVFLIYKGVSVGTNCSKSCTMVRFALSTTCCTLGFTILWKFCSIKCGQCIINNEQCKIVACTTTCLVTINIQHLSSMQI